MDLSYQRVKRLRTNEGKVIGLDVAYLLGFIFFLILLALNRVLKPSKAVMKMKETLDQEQKEKEGAPLVAIVEKKEETKTMKKATELIMEAFDRHQFKYAVKDLGQLSLIDAGYTIDGGPVARVHFVSADDDNDVAIRIYGLMHNVPKEKQAAVIDACNKVNREIRHFKFYLDKENDLVGQGDIPVNVPDETLGECCSEMFIRAMQILSKYYHFFPEAVYGGASDEKRETMLNALSALKEFRDHPISIPLNQDEDPANQ